MRYFTVLQRIHFLRLHSWYNLESGAWVRVLSSGTVPLTDDRVIKDHNRMDGPDK